jgi:hypothetical protein
MGEGMRASSERARTGRTGPSCFCGLVFILWAGACATQEVAPRDGGRDAFVALPDGGPACRGNLDGVIDRSEVVFVPGAEARYRINPLGLGVRVSTAGTTGSDGTRTWDFTAMEGELVSLQLAAVEGQWFAPQFVGAQYAARLDPRESTLGVYRATDTAVELLGAAGERESPRTLLRYDAPIALLRFPLRLGDRWSATATTVDGTIDGTPVASRDTYELHVDARGEVRLGILTFRDALRLRIEVTQRFPAGPGRRRIQYLWLTECYGEVARITSPDGQVELEFTTAQEFRRLGL